MTTSQSKGPNMFRKILGVLGTFFIGLLQVMSTSLLGLVIFGYILKVAEFGIEEPSPLTHLIMIVGIIVWIGLVFEIGDATIKKEKK